MKGRTMKVLKLLTLALAVAIAPAVSHAQQGKWLDTTKDTQSDKYLILGYGGKFLFTEDYEVMKTHEICATVTGYFMEKSELGRYFVNFKGMRTSAQFTFTTQYDAEHWVQKWCTAESLTNITAGRGELARKY